MSLSSLRSDPANATMRNAYRTAPAVNSFQTSGALAEGGRCRIEAREAATGIFDLTAVAGTDQKCTDYYFPWVRTGVGWVKVPKTVNEGTIVMTGGLNGCSIVASADENNYYFYHDGDSLHLPQGATGINGTEVARVRPSDYDPLGWGEKLFVRELEEASARRTKLAGDVSYGYFIVAVKKDGRFGFYSTGVMSLNGLAKMPVGATTCIVTFE